MSAYRKALGLEYSVQVRVDLALSYMESAMADEALEETSLVIKDLRKLARQQGGPHSEASAELRQRLKLLYGYKGLMLQSIGEETALSNHIPTCLKVLLLHVKNRGTAQITEFFPNGF